MRENLLMKNCCYEIVPTSFGWIGVIGNENSISRVTLPVESYMLAFRHLNLAVSQLSMKDVYGFVRETSLKIQRYISGENMVFDEAHLIDTWGVSFRPDFQLLGMWLKQVRSDMSVPFRTLLLSATFKQKSVFWCLCITKGQ